MLALLATALLVTKANAEGDSLRALLASAKRLDDCIEEGILEPGKDARTAGLHKEFSTTRRGEMHNIRLVLRMLPTAACPSGDLEIGYTLLPSSPLVTNPSSVTFDTSSLTVWQSGGKSVVRSVLFESAYNGAVSNIAGPGWYEFFMVVKVTQSIKNTDGTVTKVEWATLDDHRVSLIYAPLLDANWAVRGSWITVLQDPQTQKFAYVPSGSPFSLHVRLSPAARAPGLVGIGLEVSVANLGANADGATENNGDGPFGGIGSTSDAAVQGLTSIIEAKLGWDFVLPRGSFAPGQNNLVVGGGFAAILCEGNTVCVVPTLGISTDTAF